MAPAKAAGKRKTIYLLFSESSSPYRFRAVRFVQERGCVPVYPAIVKDFFSAVRQEGSAFDARNGMIMKADEVWAFGDQNASMAEQLTFARRIGKRIRTFAIRGEEFLEVGDQWYVKAR